MPCPIENLQSVVRPLSKGIFRIDFPEAEVLSEISKSLLASRSKLMLLLEHLRMTGAVSYQSRLVNQDKSTLKVPKETIFSPEPESLRTHLLLVVVTVTEKITAL